MLIGIDHGNKQIKTAHCSPFTSGLKESDVLPFGTTNSPTSVFRTTGTRPQTSASLSLPCLPLRRNWTSRMSMAGIPFGFSWRLGCRRRTMAPSIWNSASIFWGAA